MELEIERKFLLKRVPTKEQDSLLAIEQVYVEEDGVTVRYRGEKGEGEFSFDKTIKTDVDGSFVREEVISESTQEEYSAKAQESERVISKMRGIYNVGDDKWEIDQFRFFDLVIAEIEIPTKDYELVIPDWIKEVMIMEVTGMEEFKNENLADSYGKI